MLTVDECKKLLGDTKLTDRQIEELRNNLYAVAQNILDNYFDQIME